MERLSKGPNLFYAIRVDGHFARLTVRSVDRQEKPYRRLAEVSRSQRIFHLNDVNGTLAGFRFPDFSGGMNVPGFHFHFLTEDRKKGGHVLDLVLRRGDVSIDSSARFHLQLPTDSVSFHADLSHVSTDELNRAERAK